MIIMVNTAKMQLKKDAKEKIVDSVRDLFSAKIKIPLGNPSFKYLHTNQFLWNELPNEFKLKNFDVITKKLFSTYNRYTGYEKNRWYIENITITNNGDDFYAELDINPFPSSLKNYSDGKKSYEKAYKDATTKTTTTAKTNTTNVSSVNSNIKNGWWGKWVTDFVSKNVGNETDVLKRCKKMHEVFRWHVYYTKYGDMPKTGGSVNNLERVWNNDPHLNCGDGANFISAFYSCCGAKTGIYLTYDSAHYIVKCEIDGNVYWCDQSGPEGGHNQLRGWNQTYENYRSGNYKGRYV